MPSSSHCLLPVKTEDAELNGDEQASSEEATEGIVGDTRVQAQVTLWQPEPGPGGPWAGKWSIAKCDVSSSVGSQVCLQ